MTLHSDNWTGELDHGTYPLGYQINTARDHLIAVLAIGSTELRARAIVDALDAYLEEGPDRTGTFENFTPNYKSELEKVRAERDAALGCAEQALKQMQTTLDALRVRATVPEKTNGANGHAVAP